MQRFIIFSLMVFIFSGCASTGSVTIDELNIPLVDLQKVVSEALPLKKRSQSENGRGFYSEYFTVKKGEYEAPVGAFRNHAEILILGDRRPYKIEARVVVEKRQSNGEFELAKYDESLARVIIRRIQKALHERREDRNIIDDFRVF